MKYDKIDTNLFIKNRKNFINKLEQNSVAFFNSNDIYPVSADSTLPFEQHRDIFYLSGIDQEESILVLFPDLAKSYSNQAPRRRPLQRKNLPEPPAPTESRSGIPYPVQIIPHSNQ